MRGIFIRIYLAFLITSLVATLITVVLAVHYRQWSNHSVNLIAPTGGYISAAELMLQRGGEPLVLEWLLTFKRHPSVNAYVFDHQGISLTDQVPDEVLKYALAADSYQAQTKPFSRSEILVKAPIQSVNGDIYLLVVEFVHPLAVFNLPAYLAWGLLASLLVFAVWGYVLSRYLTRPLFSLRRSVRAFAKGKWPVKYSTRMLERSDEIGELGREFVQMANRLQRLMTDQRQLLSDVSHELRSPLARIAVALELVRLDSVPEQEEFLTRIELENTRLNELIEDLLNMARLDTMQQQWQVLDVRELLQQIVSDAQFEHQDSVINLQLPSWPVMLEAEPRLLSSALENIIRNALLHNHRDAAVDVMLELDSESELRVSIRDHGPGVPEHKLADLTKPFVRNEPARERSLESLDRGHRGFGLGLAIAHRVVEYHQGELTLVNHPQGGLLVSVYLPLV